VHRLDKTFGQFREHFTIFIGTSDDLVINIGDISHVVDIVTAKAHVTDNGIKHHQHTRMTKVAQVIDRHTTDVHSHLARLYRLEGFFLSGKAVMNLEHGLMWSMKSGL